MVTLARNIIPAKIVLKFFTRRSMAAQQPSWVWGAV
jgi:hypothetical protein